MTSLKWFKKLLWKLDHFDISVDVYQLDMKNGGRIFMPLSVNNKVLIGHEVLQAYFLPQSMQNSHGTSQFRPINFWWSV